MARGWKGGTAASLSASSSSLNRSKTSSFRFYIWDPLLLVLQILTIQSLSYASLGMLVSFISGILDVPLSMDLIFSDKALDVWQFAFAYLLNAIPVGFIVWYLVRRAKQCLDFSSTCILFHFLACSLYARIPRYVLWYIIHVVQLVLVTVISEYLCIRSEMNESITVSGEPIELDAAGPDEGHDAALGYGREFRGSSVAVSSATTTTTTTTAATSSYRAGIAAVNGNNLGSSSTSNIAASSGLSYHRGASETSGVPLLPPVTSPSSPSKRKPVSMF